MHLIQTEIQLLRQAALIISIILHLVQQYALLYRINATSYPSFRRLCLISVIDICQVAFSAVNPIEMSSHKRTRTTGLSRAHLPQALYLARVVHLVVLEDTELDLLVLMLLLLGLGVSLLLTLLTTTKQTKGNIELGVVSDAARGQQSSIFELATSENQSLFLRRNSLASLNRGLDISNSGIRCQLEHLSAVCESHTKNELER